MKGFRLSGAISAAAFAFSTSAQSVSRHCISGDICYGLHIPSTTANSGQGDVFFQITGPTSNQWIALGQGSGMSDTSIFLIYEDGRGNVTLSPRHGVGFVEPEHWTEADVELLAGSGVSNGQMTANIRCGNCQSWGSGQSTDFTSSSGNWVYAQRTGSPLDSTDVGAEISMHNAHGDFQWDFDAAKGGNDANPFISTNATVTSGNMTGPSSSTSDGDDDDDDDDNSTFVLVHGTLASLAFIAFFPTGGILIRLANFTGLVWVHAAVQILGYCIFTAAFGLGVWLANNSHLLSNHHPIIGIVLFCVLFLQPIGGLVHHKLFKRNGGKRTVWSLQHVWFGRVAVILGIVNGGLGLQLAGNTTTRSVAAYAVCAAVMGALYIFAIVFGEIKRKRSGGSASDEEENRMKADMYQNTSNVSSG